MEPGEPNPPDEGQHSNENDSPTEKIKSKLGISIFNLQNRTMLRYMGNFLGFFFVVLFFFS